MATAASGLTQAVPVPDHVPPEAVYDFDMRFDPGLLSDPHERARELLEVAPPVFWTPRNSGHWVVTGYEELFRAFRDWEYFSSSFVPPEMIAAFMAMMPKDQPRIPTVTPITLDPPEHGRYREPLQKTFSPKAAMARMEEIRDLTESLIDRVINEGHCDFIAAIAEPLPVTVFLKMMGLPVERLAEYRALVQELLNSTEQDRMKTAMLMRRIADSMLDSIEARREDPRDDIISLLWHAKIQGEEMNLDLMEDYAVLLFIAGLDTVINAMGYAVRRLAMDQPLQDKLRADPSLIPDAVEEMLRRYSFVNPRRRVAKDTELGGQRLKEGDYLMLFVTSADLDERQFASPDKFDLARENKVHMAFGGGAHRCLGSHLARIELQVLYQRMLERFPPWRLDPDKPLTFRSGNIIAIETLPIRWD
jgi:cytochrome P450